MLRSRIGNCLHPEHREIRTGDVWPLRGVRSLGDFGYDVWPLRSVRSLGDFGYAGDFGYVVRGISNSSTGRRE